MSERQRSGRPRKTSVRQDRVLACRARMMRFKVGRRLREEWNIPNTVSVRTVTRKLNAAGLRSRRPIKHPKLAQRHKQACLDLSRERLNCNIRSWRRIHWSDESKFMLHQIDDRLRIAVFGELYKSSPISLKHLSLVVVL